MSFRVDKTYTFIRKASRAVKMNCVTHWLEPRGGDGKQVRHALFSMRPHQASKYAKATGPKLRMDATYEVERPAGQRVRVRLYRRRPGPSGGHVYWGKKMKKPKPS